MHGCGTAQTTPNICAPSAREPLFITRTTQTTLPTYLCSWGIWDGLKGAGRDRVNVCVVAHGQTRQGGCLQHTAGAGEDQPSLIIAHSYEEFMEAILEENPDKPTIDVVTYEVPAPKGGTVSFPLDEEAWADLENEENVVYRCGLWCGWVLVLPLMLARGPMLGGRGWGPTLGTRQGVGGGCSVLGGVGAYSIPGMHSKGRDLRGGPRGAWIGGWRTLPKRLGAVTVGYKCH